MTDGIIGKATYKCNKCGTKHYLHEKDFHFEAQSSSERGMGEEIQYGYELDIKCHYCGNNIHLRFDVWEYPVGILNMTDEDATGADIIESDFDIFHAPPEDEFEKPVKLIKALILFRFDAFAEAFVDFWIKSYKKSPQLTAIISTLGGICTIAGLVISIYSSEKARIQRFEKTQSYSEQFALLKNTEENLNDLSAFISSKKSEIEATKTLIQDLETKKSELEPIVTANQKVVDAIFLQQRKEIENTIWAERGISFALGILASLIATLIWHFIGRFKKEKSNKAN